MSAEDPQRLDIEVLELPAGADWHDAVTALIELEAFWLLHPEWVVRPD